MRANYCNLKCGEKKSDRGKITTRKLRYAFDNVMRKKKFNLLINEKYSSFLVREIKKL